MGKQGTPLLALLKDSSLRIPKVSLQPSHPTPMQGELFPKLTEGVTAQHPILDAALLQHATLPRCAGNGAVAYAGAALTAAAASEPGLPHLSEGKEEVPCNVGRPALTGRRALLLDHANGPSKPAPRITQWPTRVPWKPHQQGP